MEMYKGLKFRIYPDKSQQEMIDQIIRNCNFVYNYYIRKQQDCFQRTGNIESFSQCIKELPQLKKEFPELKKGESTSLQQTLRHLDDAYKKFFGKTCLYPRFKSNRLNRNYTCTKNGCTPSNIRFEDGFLVLPKLGKVKIKLHRPVPEDLEITSATVQQTPSGKFEVSLQVKTKVEEPEEDMGEIAGIVYSPKEFFITSNSEKGEVPESYFRCEEKIKRLKKSLKRKKEGSANRVKENNKLQKAYRKSLNIRRDYLHKWSRELADRYGHIVILKKKDAEKKSQEGWVWFIQLLDYKLKEKGGKLTILEDDELSELIETLPFEERVREAKKLIELAQ